MPTSFGHKEPPRFRLFAIDSLGCSPTPEQTEQVLVPDLRAGPGMIETYVIIDGLEDHVIQEEDGGIVEMLNLIGLGWGPNPNPCFDFCCNSQHHKLKFPRG